MEAFESVRRNLFCRGLSDAEVREIIQRGTPFKPKAGAVIFEVGDAAKSLCLVLKGQVRLSRPALDGSRLVPVGLVRPRQFFGTSTVLEADTRQSRADSLVDSELLEVPIQLVVDLLRSHPQQMASNLIRQQAEVLEESAVEMATVVAEQQRDEVIASCIRGILVESEPVVTRAMLLAEDLSEQLHGRENGGQARRLLETLQALVNQKRNLAAFARPLAPRPAEQRDLHIWLKELAASLKRDLDTLGCALDAYAESACFATDFASFDPLLRNLLLRLAPLARQGGDLKLRAGLQGQEMLLRITYRHPGLTEYFALRLFEPFAMTGEGHAIGLELTAARRFARIHGGDMTLENRSGQSVTLVVRLPHRTLAELAGAPAERPETAPAAAPLS